MADRHRNINLEILKQVQDDALVGGHDKIRETYSMQERFTKNDSMREIHLPAIQSTIVASCRRASGGSASQD